MAANGYQWPPMVINGRRWGPEGAWPLGPAPDSPRHIIGCATVFLNVIDTELDGPEPPARAKWKSEKKGAGEGELFIHFF